MTYLLIDLNELMSLLSSHEAAEDRLTHCSLANVALILEVSGIV